MYGLTDGLDIEGRGNDLVTIAVETAANVGGAGHAVAADVAAGKIVLVG
jgi:hypothetical protein